MQLVNGNAIILIFITGQLSIDEAHPLKFSEVFLLFQGMQATNAV